MNCKPCHTAEQSVSTAMRKLADEGTYKIEYQLAASPDGGSGSKEDRRALNALGAAADADAGKFARYLGELLAGSDAATLDKGLLKVAGRVEGLRSPAFDRAIRELTYLPWVNKVVRTHSTKDAPEDSGIPSVALDGAPLSLHADDGRPVTPREFDRQARVRS
ncbi:hypothetical protein ACFY12_32315 [Streptomyces sp. NPDC001339]|uniref:hypothetical protein n=1 Tax=Streptomyces sp. NPDC001339 TaxID=3364563 RepID=UPI0036B63938